jgi:periplasmic protein TonB
MIDLEEKKNRRTALVTTIGFHAILLILFFFLLAWSEPDPPIPQFGIELSFVQSDSKGKIESDQQEQSQQEIDAKIDEALDPQDEVVQEQPVEEEIEENLKESTKSSEITETTEQAVENNPVKEAAETADVQETIESEDLESPDIVEEKKEEVKKEVVKPNEKSQPAKAGESSGTSKTETENKPAATPEIDKRAIYTGSTGATNAQSSSGGSSLNMSGWIWDFAPDPDDKSDESGKIIFQIIVDEEGEIIKVTTLEKTVSPIVEKKYKDAVMELTFSKTAENRSSAATSSGIITFTIKSL